MSVRRRRVWRSLAVFVIVTAAMVVLSMAQRDYQAVQACRDRLEFTRGQLQELLAHGTVAPLELPMPGHSTEAGGTPAPRKPAEDPFVARAHYFYNARYARQPDRKDPVGVCCCEAPHHLYLRPDGRHVIVFDGQRYSLGWLSEAEFQRRASALKLNVP